MYRCNTKYTSLFEDMPNTKIKPENINNLGNKLNNQLKNSRNLLSKDLKQL